MKKVTWSKLQPFFFADMLRLIRALRDEAFFGEAVGWADMMNELKTLVPGDCGWGQEGQELEWPDRELTAEEKEGVREHFGWSDSWYAQRIIEALGGPPASTAPPYAADEARFHAWWRDYTAKGSRSHDNL